MKHTIPRYKGKILEMTGEVGSVDAPNEFKMRVPQDRVGNLVVNPGICTVKPGLESKVCRLSKGQKIKIVGTYNDYVFHLIKMTDCDLIELEPSKTMVVTVESLAADYQKDWRDADMRNRNRDVIISAGKYERHVDISDPLDRLSGGTVAMYIKASGKMQLETTMPRIDFQKLAPRTVKGEAMDVRATIGEFSTSLGILKLSPAFVIPKK